MRWMGMLFLVIFASCASTDSNSQKKIFRYNEVNGVQNLDPAFAKSQSVMWTAHQLYSTLVEVDDSLHLKPLLAKSWQWSDDKKSITFFLRNDVFFHDAPCFPNGKGRLCTAYDVAYTLGRIIDPKVASPGAWIFNNRVDSIEPFKAIDDTTLQVRLLQPFQPMLGILSMQYCSIVPKEAVEHYGAAFRSHPVGTGPFQLVNWVEGQALIMKKNPAYFEKDATGSALPYLDGIRVNFFDSKATEFLEFRQGNLDFINEIDASFKDEVLTKTGKLRKEWTDKINMEAIPFLNIEYLGFLMDEQNPVMKNNPLASKKLRQAINYAIDRKKLLLYLRNSMGNEASGFIPLGMPGFKALDDFGFDPEKARKLIAEAGFGAGKPRPSVKLFTLPIYTNIGSFIANELKQAGIDVQVEPVQKSLLLEQTSRSQVPFFRGSWIADYPDAENYMSVLYGKNPAPPNYTRYNNPAFDALYEQALKESDDQKRYDLYFKMNKLIMDDAAVIPLYYDVAIHLSQKNISGLSSNSLNMLELRRVKKL